MKQSPLFVLLTLVAAGSIALAWLSPKSLADSAQAKATAETTPALQLPDFDSWAELQLTEIFKTPVGDYGFEYTEKAKQLDGKPVRISGFMAQSDWKRKDIFLFATSPIILHDIEYGQADEVPGCAVLIKMPSGETATYTKGPLTLAGTIRLGRFETPGERPIWAKMELHPDSKHWSPASRLADAPARR